MSGINANATTSCVNVPLLVSAINECNRPEGDPQRHQCDQICRDKADGYTCECGEGFQLNTDGKSCLGNRLKTS